MSWDLSLRGLAVLVVDDHADSRDLAATILRFAGASVSTASSGREALERLSSVVDVRVDVVVTDISMPDGTGYELIRDARGAGSRAVMIALTALDGPEHRACIQSSGFVSHLTKPLLPERLIAAVWEVANPGEELSAPPAAEARGPSAIDEFTQSSAARARASSGGPRDSTG